MSDPITDLRQRNRVTWAAGEWDEVAELVAEVGPRLLDRVGVEGGMDVTAKSSSSRSPASKSS